MQLPADFLKIATSKGKPLQEGGKEVSLVEQQGTLPEQEFAQLLASVAPKEGQEGSPLEVELLKNENEASQNLLEQLEQKDKLVLEKVPQKNHNLKLIQSESPEIGVKAPLLNQIEVQEAPTLQGKNLVQTDNVQAALGESDIMLSSDGEKVLEDKDFFPKLQREIPILTDEQKSSEKIFKFGQTTKDLGQESLRSTPTKIPNPLADILNTKQPAVAEGIDSKAMGKILNMPSEAANDDIILPSNMRQVNAKMSNGETKPFISSEDFLQNHKMNFPQQVKGQDELVMNQKALKSYGHEQKVLEQSLIAPKMMSLQTEGIPQFNAKTSRSETVTKALFDGSSEIPKIDQLQEHSFVTVKGNESGADIQSGHKAQQLKTLDLSHIKSENSAELLNKISNYIEQSHFQNRTQVDLVVKHDDLGLFRVHANKVQGDGQVNLQIMTNSDQARDFFTRHETDMIKNLQQSGIKLSNVRITGASDSMLGSQADSKGSSFSDSSHTHRGLDTAQQGQRHSHQESSDSQRRKELWDRYRESFYAA